MVELKEFLIQSPNGKTHALNPKNNKTYCGKGNGSKHGLEDLGWRFRDVLPDKNHEPTCKICLRHYDDPLNAELTSIVKDLELQIHEFLSLKIMLKDVSGIGRFTENIAKFLRREQQEAK